MPTKQYIHMSTAFHRISLDNYDMPIDYPQCFTKATASNEIKDLFENPAGVWSLLVATGN